MNDWLFFFWSHDYASVASIRTPWRSLLMLHLYAATSAAWPSESRGPYNSYSKSLRWIFQREATRLGEHSDQLPWINQCFGISQRKLLQVQTLHPNTEQKKRFIISSSLQRLCKPAALIKAPIKSFMLRFLCRRPLSVGDAAKNTDARTIFCSPCSSAASSETYLSALNWDLVLNDVSNVLSEELSAKCEIWLFPCRLSKD